MNTTDPVTVPVAAPARRQRTAGHIIAIVLGCLALLPAGGALAGGTAIAVAKSVATDDQGYFQFTIDRVESDGVAVATNDVWFEDVESDEGDPWVLDWLDLDLRLRVDAAGPTDDVFVGIARTADVEAYLRDVRHSLVEDVEDHTPVYRQVAGTAVIGAPGDQDFWAATATATDGGEAELDWEARGGRWSIVVMNADGSPQVAADVEVGARSGAVTPIMVTLLVAGGIGLLVSVALIVWGARGRTRPTTGTPLPPPTPVRDDATPLGV